MVTAEMSCNDTAALNELVLFEGSDMATNGMATNGGVAGIGVILAEPHYHCCAGRQTLTALTFWYQLRALRPCARPDSHPNMRTRSAFL